MKYFIKAAFSVLAMTFPLAGCGGGGSGGGVATGAVTKLYLFGNLTSTARIATVQTSMTVPAGVMVNYTSPTGATTGIYPLRKGFVVPSGPVTLSGTDVSGSYDLTSRILTISMVNNGRLALKSSTTANGGKGEEIATVYFRLNSPGVTPSSMPLEDALATVSEELPGDNVVQLPDGKVNFTTSFQ